MQSVKVCPKCQTLKPLEEFRADRTKKDGRMSRCAACDNLASHQRRLARMEADPDFKEKLRTAQAASKRKSRAKGID